MPFSRQCCLYRDSITLAGEEGTAHAPTTGPKAPGQHLGRVPGSTQTLPWGSPQLDTPLYSPHLCGQGGPSASEGAAGKLSCRPGTR